MSSAKCCAVLHPHKHAPLPSACRPLTCHVGCQVRAVGALVSGCPHAAWVGCHHHGAAVGSVSGHHAGCSHGAEGWVSGAWVGCRNKAQMQGYNETKGY